MEEVWKDLTVVSSQPTSATATASAGAATRPPLYWLTDQEILAGPWKKHTATELAPADKTETPFLHYALKSTTDSCACSTRKRSPSNYENAPDQKNKRLIKNRESAALSRAKKQAYTYELEAEVAHLMQENAKLRKQQEKLCVAAVGHHHEKRHKLCRTLTAPF